MASSVLICYVRDANNTSAINVSNTGEITYASGTLTSQDGTMAGAAKCNVYYGTTTYGTGENISCSFGVNTSMLKFAVKAPDGVSAGDAATLTYKTNGTELAAASFTVGEGGKNTVYMAVPAGQYTGAQTLNYKSGSADESKTLSASKATFAAGSTYSKILYYESAVDISMYDCAGNVRDKQWTANCYMIHKGGNYKLPLVYGNAIKDGDANTAAYTGIENENTTLTFPNHAGNAITTPWIKDHSITIASAELLWQDAQGLILEVGIDGDYLTFTVGKDASVQEGNALVAAKDGEGNIVWSWHIWVTKQTFASEDLTVVNTDTGEGGHTYTVTPVNLGWVGDAVSATGYNTYYQWGRKDAFIPGTGTDNNNHTVYDINNVAITGLTYEKNNAVTIADDIKNPTKFYYNSSTWGPCTTGYYNMWDAQQTGTGNIKTATVKTVYDPCPAGFCVPSSNFFNYIVLSVANENFAWEGTNKGRTLTAFSPSVFFPASGFRYDNVSDSLNGRVGLAGRGGYCWSSTSYDNTDGRYLYFADQTDRRWSGRTRSSGLPVRPVAEE